MKRALQVVLGIEIALGILWTLRMAMAFGDGGLAVLGLFVVVYAPFAAFFVFAAWAYWRHRDKRRIAGWIMALPILFWFLPSLIRSLSGGVLSQQQLFQLLVLLAIAVTVFCWIAPRRAAAVVPGFLVQSRLFNWLILLALVAAWTILLLVVFNIANAKSPSTSGTGEGLALAIVMAAIYLAWLGVGSIGATTWAWVSLRSGVARAPRKLNIAQCVVAAPGILIGVAVAAWLAGQGQL